MTSSSLTRRILATAAVGGALCVAAAGPAGASTVGLLKASQLPSGYKALEKPITISGGSILKATKGLGGGLGAATASCKGSPSATALKNYSAHLAVFEKGASASSIGILGEIVLQAPSAASATSYVSAVKAATGSCTGTQKITMSGLTVTVSYKSHTVSIGKAGADSAVGTVVKVSATTTSNGVKAVLTGALGVETYRKGADIVQLIVDNFGVKDNASAGSVAVTFTPGSSALVDSVGKAAIKDL